MNSRGRYRPLPGSLNGMNIGYITIPTGCERKDFIDTCMRRCKVMVYFDGGVFKQDVPITREALNNITFPDSPGELGSPVAVMSDRFTNASIVVGTLVNETETPSGYENTIQFRKTVNGVSCAVTIDPTNNHVSLDVQSKNEVSVDVNATGSENAKVNLYSTGSINVKGCKKVESTSYKEHIENLKNPELPKEKIDDEIYEIKHDLDQLSYKQVYGDDKITNSIMFDKDKFELVQNTSKQTITVSDDKIEIMFGEGNDTFRMTKDKIEILSGKLVEVNGGSNNEVIKIDDLTTKLNNLVTQVNAFISTYNTHIHPASPSPTGTTTMQGKTCDPFSKGDYADENFTH